MGGLGSGRKPASAGLVKGKTPMMDAEGRRTQLLAGQMGRTLTVAGDQEAAIETVVRHGRGRHAPTYRNAMLMALSAAGMKQAEIADLVGMTHRSVRTTLYQLRKQGVLADTTDRLQHEIVPDALEALHADIQGPAGKLRQTAALAALTGAGVLRTAEAKAGAVGSIVNQLQVVFQLPEGGRVPEVQGQVVGVPREDA